MILINLGRFEIVRVIGDSLNKKSFYEILSTKGRLKPGHGPGSSDKQLKSF